VKRIINYFFQVYDASVEEKITIRGDPITSNDVSANSLRNYYRDLVTADIGPDYERWTLKFAQKGNVL
jgi:hypothetical protein